MCITHLYYCAYIVKLQYCSSHWQIRGSDLCFLQADTTAMDNIRGADITDGTIAGSTETISDNVTHTASGVDTP